MKLAGTGKSPEPHPLEAVVCLPGQYSDLYEIEADYARALIRYAWQDGLSLTVNIWSAGR